MLRTPTWLLVLIGLLFNICAALITHFLIADKYLQQQQLSIQITSNDKEINLLWIQIEGIERKREILYLLASQGVLKDPLATQFSRLLENYLQQPVPVSSLLDITLMDQKINHYQELIRHKIDDKFLLNLELAELEGHLQSEISGLRNWSIFLQMIGLALILARDLTIKRRAL